MLIYGKQPVLYAALHHPERIEVLYVAKELDKKLYNRLMNHTFTVQRTKPEHIQSLCKSGNHQGFLAQIKPIELYDMTLVKPLERVVVLSGVTDMGNIGAIVRSCFALGVEALIVCGIKNLQLDHLARTSSGALLDLPLVTYENVLDCANILRQFGFSLYGAATEGEDIRHLKTPSKWALFMGSEGEGLAPKLLNKLDKSVKISMSHDFDSLNVSVATAILIDRMRNDA